MTPSAPVCPSKKLSMFTFKTFPCVPAASPHVSYMWAWCRYTRGRFESTHGKRFERVHGFFFHVFFTVPQHTKHTPRPPTTPRPQRHHHHNDTHHITQHGDRNRERQRKRDKRRQEKTRQDKKAREEKRREEEEERRRREKMKEKMNRDKQFFRECPPAPELFSRQIPENVRQRRNYLAQMSEMSAGAGIN